MRKADDHPPEGLLRAAVMLHTDREAYERLQSPVVETTRECGIHRHADYARSLVGLLALQTDASRDFARRWLTAMALWSQWDLCLDDARRWTREGLRWFPKDATLLLIQGTASESAAAMWPRVARLGDKESNRESLQATFGRRGDLTAAKRDLEAAVARDPELHEARVRLGRVLWTLGRPDEARTALEAAVRQARDPSLAYLARLFLGRVLEDTKDLPGAVAHYREALAIDPHAQAAALALSEALLLQGEEGESRRVADEALAHAPRPQPRDPYLTYRLGRAAEAEERFEALRQETLQ